MMLNDANTAVNGLEQLANLNPCYMNWHEEGGALVYRLEWDTYVLFEVPQYGGASRYSGTYPKAKLEELVRTAFSWT